MHKFYWNNKPQHLKPQPAATFNVRGSRSDYNIYGYGQPQVPARNEVKTVVKVSTGQPNVGAAKNPPTGSHRVLLKLRRMSKGGQQERPKSVNLDTVSLKGPEDEGQRPGHFEFYHRTWNERSLSKYASSHNYENVYSGGGGPETSVDGRQNYYEGSSGHRLNLESSCYHHQASAAPDYENFPIRIHDLSASPSAKGGRRSILPQDHNTTTAPPIPPARKGRRKATNHPSEPRPPLYRSKSCERPTNKMKSNLTKFSTRILNQTQNSIFNKFSCVNNNSNKVVTTSDVEVCNHNLCCNLYSYSLFFAID